MKRLKKLTTLSLALALCLTSAIPAFAQTDTTQEANTTGTKEAAVTINAGSNFKVTVPSTISVSQSSKAVLNESYNVKVEGDITGTETIKVVPDSTFNLTQSNKTDIPVTVNQPKTEFLYDEINGTNGCTTTGTLTTDTEVTAGTWTGNLTFNIQLAENAVQMISFTIAGTPYQAEEGMTWEQWINSDYNTDGYLRPGENLITNSNVDRYVFDSAKGAEYSGCVIKTDIIKSNYNYSTWSDLLVPVPVLEPGLYEKGTDNLLMSWDKLLADGEITVEDGIITSCSTSISGDLVIDDSVTTIGDNAFYNCQDLTGITIPGSVTAIGSAAFWTCVDLASVTIPDSVTTISSEAFSFCINLTSVTVPDSVTYIGDDAFDKVPHIEYHGTATGSPWGAQSIN